MSEFITNNYGISLEGQVVGADMVVQAVKMVNSYFKDHIVTEEDIDFYSSLLEGGALSSGIGALFNQYLAKLSNNNLMVNPVRGGNPDILNMAGDEAKKRFEYNTSKFGNNVNVWAPEVFGYIQKYEYGGIETKCTSLTKPPKTMKNSHISFGWGEQRIKFSKSFCWSAHHNENDNLCGIVWDFVNGLPKIVCVMYSELKFSDWGKPHKTEGNKSTNGYSLNGDGIRKMKDGWLCVLDDQDYIDAFKLQMRTGDGVTMKPLVSKWKSEENFALW